MKIENPKPTDNRLIVGFFIFLLLLLLLSVFLNNSRDEKDKALLNQTEKQSEISSIPTTEIVSETQSEVSTENINDYSDLSEDDYKAQCVQMYHDDIFFSENDLEGQLVKVDLFLEEPYTFTAKSSRDSLTVDFIEKNNVQKDYFMCGVKRDSESLSYVGGQLELYFTNNSNLNCQDYSTGQHLTVYGQIVGYTKGNDTWKGYAHCELVAKYIDVND